MTTEAAESERDALITDNHRLMDAANAEVALAEELRGRLATLIAAVAPAVRLAMKATGGEWFDEPAAWISGPDHKGKIAECAPIYGGATEEHRRNAAAIAAAMNALRSPEVVALVGEEK